MIFILPKFDFPPNPFSSLLFLIFKQRRKKSFFRPLLIMSQNILSMLLLYFIMHVWIRFVLFTFLYGSLVHLPCSCYFNQLFFVLVSSGSDFDEIFFGIAKFFCRFFYYDLKIWRSFVRIFSSILEDISFYLEIKN